MLVSFIAIDYLSGVLVAIAHKDLNSKIGFKGIAKKLLILILVSIGALLDKLLVGSNGVLRTAICAFYISNEGLSILENAGKLGLPLPKALKSALEQLNEEPKK